MRYKVVPDTFRFGLIPTATLEDAIGIKHLLFAKMGIRSEIYDDHGKDVTETEQSEHIFSAFC